MKIFAIHDAKASFYGQPFYARANGEAIRTFAGAINGNQPENLMSTSPGDFTLFYIGDYDDQTGVITPATPSSLGNGVEYKQQ